jgi:hypothetical protein
MSVSLVTVAPTGRLGPNLRIPLLAERNMGLVQEHGS